MAKITFYPKAGTTYTGRWPDKLLGDGFIDLKLDISDSDSAIYVDSFREEYEIFNPYDGEWDIEIRED